MELVAVFPEVESLFDAIIAENGAILVRKAGLRRLVEPIPMALDEALLHRGVRFRRGQVLLASTAPFANVVLEELARLGLDCQIVRNRNEIMILPAGVTKGTGLAMGLAELGISPHDAVGIGDAENDHSLLDACEMGVAVANAVPSLKAHADLVLEERGERGVVRFLRSPIFLGEQPVEPKRWRVELGKQPDGSPAQIPASGLNVLFEGDSLSGKSYAAGLFAEGLLALGYSVCILDPEGDHRGLGGLHGCMLLGGHETLPSSEQFSTLFPSTFGSAVVDLSLLTRRERLATGARYLEALQRQREQTGLPHWIVLDEAQVLLGDDGPACALFHPEQKGFCLVTYQPDHLCASARESIDLVVSAERAGRARIVRARSPEAAVEFILGPRASAHVRHRHKYVHTELRSDRRFYFWNAEGGTGPSAGNLEQFHDLLKACGPAVLRHHLMRNDFSRWVEDVMQDRELGQRLFALEQELRGGTTAGLTEQLRAEILDEVERRYLR
jgi:hypothetical protein